MRRRNRRVASIAELQDENDRRMNSRFCRCGTGMREHGTLVGWLKCPVCGFCRLLEDTNQMSVLDDACELIAGFEGFRTHPYQNPGDRPTIGYGTTFYENGTAVTLKDQPIAEERGMQILRHVVARCIDRVRRLVEVEITDNQLVALTSFEYNTGALATSTLLRDLNQQDFESAADEFLRWTHCAGKVLQALVTRRTQERELFLKGET